MSKFHILTINTLTIISILYFNPSWGNDIVYIKKTFFSTNPKPSISATSTDGKTKWFDDNPSAKSNDELELGFNLPRNYGLTIKNIKLSGVHSGEATKYVCILGSCSYIGSGIVAGNSSTDKISYDIESWQVIYDHSYKLNNKIKLKPKIGINILDTKLEYSGTGQNVIEKQLVPLPFFSIYSEVKINFNYSAYIDSNYFKIKQNKIVLHYYDTSIGLNYHINKYLKLAAGYKNFDLGISNKGGSSNISFNIDHRTPFLAFSLNY